MPPAGDPASLRRDAMIRHRFIQQGSTNPLSPEDWIASLVPAEAAEVLEVGAGWGAFALRFLELRGETVRRYVATESDEEACGVLGITLASRAPVVSAEVADPLDLSRYRERFDAAVCADVVHSLHDPARALGEILASLRRGGFAVVVTAHRDNLAELWTLVRTYDPSFPKTVHAEAFDSETAPGILDSIDRPWEAFDYENVLEVTPEAAVEFVEAHFAILRISRDAEWSRGLARFLGGWSGEFFWAVQRRAGFVLA